MTPLKMHCAVVAQRGHNERRIRMFTEQKTKNTLCLHTVPTCVSNMIPITVNSMIALGHSGFFMLH